MAKLLERKEAINIVSNVPIVLHVRVLAKLLLLFA